MITDKDRINSVQRIPPMIIKKRIRIKSKFRTRWEIYKMTVRLFGIRLNFWKNLYYLFKPHKYEVLFG